MPYIGRAVDIEFDTVKDSVNRAKHGLSLEFGAEVIIGRVADLLDPRHSHEARRIAYGIVAGRLFVCVYTVRGKVYRIISVRKANKREQRKWQS